jgi:hypothetical protein
MEVHEVSLFLVLDVEEDGHATLCHTTGFLEFGSDVEPEEVFATFGLFLAFLASVVCGGMVSFGD